MGNIERFLDLRRRSGHTFVSVTFVRQALNEHEVSAFRRRFHGKVDDIIVRDVRDWAGAVRVRSRFDSRETNPNLPRFPCKLLWSRLVVLVDGSVALCEVDWDGEYVVGDVVIQTIAEIWNGGAIQRFRLAHLDEGYERVTPCRDCRVRESWW